MGKSDRQVMSWFECWQAVSSFSFALYELRLNLNPCLVTYCTCHVTISTSCVWLKVKYILIGWFHPSCLLHFIAIS